MPRPGVQLNELLAAANFGGDMNHLMNLAFGLAVVAAIFLAALAVAVLLSITGTTGALVRLTMLLAIMYGIGFVAREM